MISRKFTILIAALASLSLQACSTPEEEVIVVQKPTFEQTQFDLMNPNDVDPLEMASAASNPNVQIFPFDKPGVTASGLPLKAPAGDYVADPSVEVFPLDNPYQQQQEMERTALLPASDALLDQPTMGLSKPTSPNFVSIAAPGEPLVRIYFAHDSSDLDPSSMKDISAISARFNPNRADYILSVEGHASLQSSENDPVKRRIINMRVATDRAYNVARALMEAGIAPEKIRTVSWGESSPSGPHDGMDANAASRRVEIFRLK
ncbi:MAG TPA: OmpA family protein [Alphaproteobacteria bacterium]|nr:OmpA family protein [Alphaproteobacteria bacterium]